MYIACTHIMQILYIYNIGIYIYIIVIHDLDINKYIIPHDSQYFV